MSDFFEAIALVIFAIYVIYVLLYKIGQFFRGLFGQPSANLFKYESGKATSSSSHISAPVPQALKPEKSASPAPKLLRISSPQEVFSKEYISYTRIRTYHECPRKFELRYLYKLPEETGRAGQIGKLIHKIIELFFLDRGNRIEPSMFSSDFSRIALKYFKHAKNAISLSLSLREDELIPFLDNFASINRKTGATELIHEKKIMTTFGDYKLMCVIDRLDHSDMGITRIIDYKTGGKASVTATQLNLYALALQLEEKQPVELQYQFLADGTTRNWTFSNRSRESARRWIIEGINRIESASHFPGDSGAYKCRYCGVTDYCGKYPWG